MVIDRLIESHSKQRKDAEQAAGPSACDLELWEDIAPMLADFNRESEDEAHGRKDGASGTQRLIKNREQLTGEAVDEELDFLEEDDNIVRHRSPATCTCTWVPVAKQYSQYSRGVPYSSVHQKHICNIYTYISTAAHPWGRG